MNRYEFLYRLDKALTGISPTEKAEIVRYYEELIQDARDSGDDETDFIDRLGSVETIVRTIRKDEGFVTNVREKKDFQLRKVFDITVRIAAYALFGLFVIVAGSLAFSFLVSGVSLVFTAIVAYFRDSVADPTTATLMMYAGGALIGAGLFLAGIWGFKTLIRASKGLIEKSLEFVEKIRKKIGELK
ncbi:MAG: DUF1700 domain-containing protein [Candidatus Izemoplasmatales bacterium]